MDPPSAADQLAERLADMWKVGRSRVNDRISVALRPCSISMDVVCMLSEFLLIFV